MRYFLCNKCGENILFVPEGEGAGGVCTVSTHQRTFGICGGEYTIELVKKDVKPIYLIRSEVSTIIEKEITKLHKKRTRFFASMKKIKLTPVMAMRKAYQLRDIDKDILILKQ